MGRRLIVEFNKVSPILSNDGPILTDCKLQNLLIWNASIGLPGLLHGENVVALGS